MLPVERPGERRGLPVESPEGRRVLPVERPGERRGPAYQVMLPENLPSRKPEFVHCTSGNVVSKPSHSFYLFGILVS